MNGGCGCGWGQTTRMSELDLPHLLSQFNLSQESLEKQCCDDLFLTLSQKIVSFDDAAPHFGFTQAEIKELRHDYSGERSRKMNMLWDWKRRKGSGATNLAIVKIFLHMKDKSLAELVLEKSLSVDSYKSEERITDDQNRENTSENHFRNILAYL